MAELKNDFCLLIVKNNIMFFFHPIDKVLSLKFRALFSIFTKAQGLKISKVINNVWICNVEMIKKADWKNVIYTPSFASPCFFPAWMIG